MKGKSSQGLSVNYKELRILHDHITREQYINQNCDSQEKMKNVCS